MDRKLADIEKSLQDIMERLEKVERKVSILEPQDRSVKEHVTESGSKEIGDEDSTVLKTSLNTPAGTKLFSVLGRTFLVLAGAFLLRVFTDGEVLPQLPGVVIGLLYSAVWLYFCNRSAQKNETFSATFHGISSVIIAFPILYEASIKLNVFNPFITVIILFCFTSVALLISAYRNLKWVYSIYVLSAIFTSFVLIYNTGEVEFFIIFLLLLSLSSLAFKYFKSWHFLPWVSTFLLNVAILFVVSLASHPDNLGGRYSELSIPFSLAIIISYMVIYISVFVIATINLKRQISIFGIFQSLFALIIGLAGSITITHGTGAGYYVLGSLATLFSVGFYGIAFLYLNPQEKFNFYYYTWMAFVLAIAGIWVLFNNTLMIFIFSLLSVVTIYLTIYFERFNTLSIQSALYLLIAAIFSGVIKLSVVSFVSYNRATPAFTPVALILIIVMLIVYILHIILRKESLDQTHVPRFGILIIAVLCVFGLIVSFTINTLALNEKFEYLNTVLLKTMILSFAAIILAWLSNKTKIYELSLLVYPVLILGGIKILVYDLSKGTPTTLFIGFFAYGLALIFAPKLKRKNKKEQ